jgi:hypothetical protein
VTIGKPMRTSMLAATAAMAMCVALSARGDSPPPPFLAEQPFLAIIEKAGFHCVQAISHTPATGPDAEAYRKLGLEPFVVECIIGKKYLVGRTPFDPGGRPPPPIAPQVKEIPDPDNKPG